MASTFKNLTDKDVVSTKTLLHEAIPLTGAIVSGTYSDENIKTFAHGMFQAVYDYPYLSSSANHVFDITCGYSAKSALSSSASSMNTKKINMYTQMAQVLAGYDVTGAVQQFDEDGNIAAGGDKLKECIFVNMARLITKDEIKKGTFYLVMGMNSASSNPYADNVFSGSSLVQIYDRNAENDYRVNSPAGEYGILYMKNYLSTGHGMSASINSPCGLLYYQAGVAVLTASIFDKAGENRAGVYGFLSSSVALQQNIDTWSTGSFTASAAILTSSTIDAFANSFRHRVYNLQFNNTTELNSTVYFCRVSHNEFNYSANLTYLSQSKIRVKQNSTDAPVSYVTTIGLYSVDNELLATAKLSEPLKKDPTNELTLRVRLDY